MINPITKIVNLFKSYADAGVVTAKEYNANIDALQSAIEHNGNALKEQQHAIESLTAGSVPDGGITTELIADAAVTADKLSENLQKYSLLTPDALADYFKNLLPSHIYKTSNTLTGSLLNGSITEVNKTLTAQTDYKTEIKHASINREWDVMFEDNGDEIEGTLQNTVEDAATFKVGFARTTQFFQYSGGWIVQFDLGEDKAYNVGEAGDKVSFSWRYQSTFSAPASGSGYPYAKSYLSKVVLKNNSGAVIANADNILNLFDKEETIKKDYYDYRHTTVTYSLKTPVSGVFKQVRYIEFHISYLYNVGRYFDNMRDVKPYQCIYLDSHDITLTKLSTNAAATNTTLKHNMLLSAAGTKEALTVTALVNTINNVQPTKDALGLTVNCVCEIPSDLAPGHKEGLKSGNYIVENFAPHANASFKVEAEGTDSYFVEWEFKPPVVIKGEDADGNTYSWIQYNGNYIYPEEAPTILTTLTNDYNLVNTACIPFEVGEDSVYLQIGTNITNLTIESISVARYSVGI